MQKIINDIRKSLKKAFKKDIFILSYTDEKSSKISGLVAEAYLIEPDDENSLKYWIKFDGLSVMISMKNEKNEWIEEWNPIEINDEKVTLWFKDLFKGDHVHIVNDLVQEFDYHLFRAHKAENLYEFTVSKMILENLIAISEVNITIDNLLGIVE